MLLLIAPLDYDGLHLVIIVINKFIGYRMCACMDEYTYVLKYTFTHVLCA